jgi:hypothetical protein
MVNPAVREIVAEDTCAACGHPMANHFRLVARGKTWIGCVDPPLTDGSIRAAIVAQQADQAHALAGVIAALTSRVPFERMPADEQQRRTRQAARTLREWDLAAEKVARFRASNMCAAQIEGLLYGSRRALSSGERYAAQQISVASVNAYLLSLEGLADERQADPAFDAGIAERLKDGA